MKKAEKNIEEIAEKINLKILNQLVKKRQKILQKKKKK